MERERGWALVPRCFGPGQSLDSYIGGGDTVKKEMSIGKYYGEWGIKMKKFATCRHPN